MTTQNPPQILLGMIALVGLVHLARAASYLTRTFTDPPHKRGHNLTEMINSIVVASILALCMKFVLDHIN